MNVILLQEICVFLAVLLPWAAFTFVKWPLMRSGGSRKGEEPWIYVVNFMRKPQCIGEMRARPCLQGMEMEPID